MEDAPPQPAAAKVYIFDDIRSLQAQHGLKHGDYTRYRQYCTRRLAKLRTRVNFHHGRKTFQKKELKMEMIEDERWLEMLLLEAERAWAGANEVKAEMDKNGTVHTNKRRHMLRRFAKARKNADVLVQGCRQLGDTRRVTEATAYLDLLTALDQFERGTQVDVAAGHFLRARRALEALSGVGPASSKSACRQKITEIESVLRLCVHRASQGAGKAVTEADLELPTDSVLEEGIAAVRSLTSDTAGSPESAAHSSSFTWRGHTVPVQEAAIEAELAKARSAAEQLEQLAAKPEDGGAAAMEVDGAPAGASGGGGQTPAAGTAARVKAHDDVIGALTRAKALLTQSAEASSSGVREGVDADAQAALLAAVSGALVEAVLRRHTLQAGTLNGRFKRNMARALSKSKEREKGARAEDCVRLYDGLVKAALELERCAALEGMPPSATEALVANSEAFAALYSAARCYYIAHLRLAKPGADDAATAQALFLSSRDRLEAASQALRGGLPQEQADIVDCLAPEAAAYSLVAQAESAVCMDREDSKLAGGLQGMGLAEGGAAGAPASEYLADQLHEWKSFVGSTGSQARIFKVTGLMETIPMRPITLDTAEKHIPEPDVSHRCRARARAPAVTEAPSVISGIKGLFGFGYK